MNGYVAILKIRAQTLLQYRSATFAAVCTQLFWSLLNVMLFRAFYSGASLQAFSLEQAITFVWLAQALLQVIPWSNDREIEAQVKNGNVAYELVRPLHLYGLWFARSFALRSIPTLMRCLPIFLIGGLWLGLSAPVSWGAGVVFFFSVLFALLLSSSITTLVLTSLFWTVSGEGVQRLMPHFTLLFSGTLIPLPLFPSWMQPFLNLQPFRGVMDIPCRLYTGIIPLTEAGYYLGFQLAWALFFISLGKWLMQRAMQKLTIQGG